MTTTQLMLVFLMSLYDALWRLFVNGHKPVLRPHRYSVKACWDGRQRLSIATRRFMA
jgi:hypothetical protein